MQDFEGFLDAWLTRSFPMQTLGLALVTLLTCTMSLWSQRPADKFMAADEVAQEATKQAWLKAASQCAEQWTDDRRFANTVMQILDEAAELDLASEALGKIGRFWSEPSAFQMPVPDSKEALDILAACRKEIGAASEAVLKVPSTPGQAGILATHLQRALTVDPGHKAKTEQYRKMTNEARAKENLPVLRTLVMRAAELDPEGYAGKKYTTAEELLVKKEGGITVQGRDHYLQALVRLPADWSPKKKWPMVVAVVGANCAYRSQLDQLVKDHGNRKSILVVPLTISNANEFEYGKMPYPKSRLERMNTLDRRPQRLWSDIRGLASVLQEIRRRFSGEDEFFMTGYSGGGFLTYAWILHYPETLRGACLASANYMNYVEGDARSPVGPGCPILVVTGAQDSAGEARIFPQSDEGTAALKRLGFQNVERRHLPNRGHESFYELCFELFDSIQSKATKR